MQPFSLSRAQAGSRIQVVELKAEALMVERLRSMGLGRGRVLEVLLDEARRPLIIGFVGSGQRVALAREIAEHVMVRPWSDEEQA